MKKGGLGGSHTWTGLKFEKSKGVLDIFEKTRGFHVNEKKIYKGGKLLAESYPKNSFYKFLESKNINFEKILSGRIIPDDTLLVLKTKTFFIFEKKFQEVSGSTDEKLQTAQFKILQYRKLLEPLGYKVMFVYLLNNWFKQQKYKDVLNYIRTIEGCNYFFEDIPLNYLGV